MEVDYRAILSLIASLLAIYAFIPYIRGVLAGTAKPHLFTWIIWGLITLVACAAQIAGGAGVGAWSTAVVAALSCVVAVLAVKGGEKNITRSDWIAFIAALLSIPAWALTDNPFWAVLIVTLIDVLAYWPTVRKAWLKPHEEPALMYGLGFVRHSLTLLAMEQASGTTLLFPAALIFTNIGTFLMLIIRRRAAASVH